MSMPTWQINEIRDIWSEPEITSKKPCSANLLLRIRLRLSIQSVTLLCPPMQPGIPARLRSLPLRKHKAEAVILILRHKMITLSSLPEIICKVYIWTIKRRWNRLQAGNLKSKPSSSVLQTPVTRISPYLRLCKEWAGTHLVRAAPKLHHIGINPAIMASFSGAGRKPPLKTSLSARTIHSVLWIFMWRTEQRFTLKTAF